MTYSRPFTPPATTTNFVAFTGMPKRTRRTTKRLMPANGDGSTLSLDFTTGVLDPRFTFTRSTTGTYINSSGYVTSAAINTPRFDYDPTTLTPRGLLIEGSANSFTRSSQDLTNATYWTLQTAYASTSTAGGTAPDGTNSGNLFTEPSSSLQRSIYQSYSSAAGTYTFSVWLKAGSGSTRYMRLVVSSSASDFGYVTINMSTGAVQQSAAISGTATNASATVSGNYSATGWRRYSLTVTLAASVNFVFLIPTDLASIDTPTSNYGRIQYLGDGSSFLVWGAQLETGSGASSYIPTGASTGSRAFDSCVMNDITSCNYSTTNGSMYYEGRFSKVNDASFPWRAGFTKESTDERCFGFLTNSGGSSVEAKGPGATPTASVSQTIAVNTNYKIAWSLDASLSTGEVRKSSNGSVVSVSGATALTVTGTPTYFMFGQKGYQDYFPCGTIKAFKYWPTTLSDGQLQASTT